MSRSKQLTRTLVFRIDQDLASALQRDADENGRTVAQSVRFLLSRSLVREASR